MKVLVAHLATDGALRRRASVPRQQAIAGAVVLTAALAAGAFWLTVSPGIETRPIAPPFQLTDQTGQVVSLDTFAGRPLVVTFLYTRCTDVCPLVLSRLQQAMRGSGADVTRPEVVVITVDPTYDTVERLREYSAAWDPQWKFLTGGATELSPVWDAYGVTVEKKGEGLHPGHTDYEVVHSRLTVLIDREGRIASSLPGDWSAEQLEQALTRMEAGGQTRSSPGPMLGVASFFRACGDFATAHPLAFLALTAVIAAPGLLLAAALWRAFVHPASAEPAVRL
ncbi:MAG: SCO family protein [Chloroflexi bacterium]|nr:SCO family protein [Chloroflexota bacterium]